MLLCLCLVPLQTVLSKKIAQNFRKSTISVVAKIFPLKNPKKSVFNSLELRKKLRKNDQKFQELLGDSLEKTKICLQNLEINDFPRFSLKIATNKRNDQKQTNNHLELTTDQRCCCCC